MAALEPWQLALLIIACVLVVIVSVVYAVKAWAKGAYQRQLANPKTKCDIDSFVGPNHPAAHVKVALGGMLTVGNRPPNLDPIPLQVVKSPHVDGLYVTKRAGNGGENDDNAISLEQLFAESSEKPIVVCTIRMGFGHHRLAYSAASWAQQTGRPTVFHDLISIPSDEASLIKSTDELYSKFSRLASECGGIVEKIWGNAMKQGDANALRMAAYTAAHLQPLLLAVPKDTPIVTTHQLCALVASAAGFENVVNLVVDNHPQWFLTVPNTLNLVQGPVNYFSFLRFGIDAKELAWAGHWCPYDMVSNIDVDCQRRIARARDTSKPLRILIPVGGAGAQRTFIIQFVKALAPFIRSNQVQVMLNAGDHVHMKTAFLQVLDECGLDFDTVGDTAGVMAFQKRLLGGRDDEPAKNVTLFSFEEYFPAVATTDLLCRVADVLACKPSELAFYCVPKLHIRRVGDHEADSAKRSSEAGDGTEEAREVEDAVDYINLFLSCPDMLVTMNEAIIQNNKINIYGGCQKAVMLALEREDKK